MASIVVVEVNPGSLRAARVDPVRPCQELILRIVMAIPTLGPMQPQIDIVGGSNKLVREPRPAAGAEDRAGLPKGSIHGLVPPAGMTELNDIAEFWIELIDDRGESCLGISITRWKLEEKASHPFAQNIGNHAEISYERFRAFEPLNMRDELADFYGVDKIFLFRLPLPSFDVSYSWPRIKRCVDFNRVEALGVMLKPFTRRQALGIK